MTRKPNRKYKDKAVHRRTVLEWLGGATVLALGGPLLTRILSGQSRHALTPGLSGANGLVEAADIAGKIPPGKRYAFEPGIPDESIIPAGRERTVDPQDLASILATWRLTVDGLVQSPRTLTFAEILKMPSETQVTDLHCVEGWSVYDIPWNGLPLWKLAKKVKPLPSATHVTFHTVGGSYNESLPLSVALEPRTLMAYGIAGYTLPLKHGFPLRIVIPRLLGYKNAKYVERIEFTDKPSKGFWVYWGYDYGGEVSPDRLRSGKY